jgi:hypothetical protein
MPHYSQCNTSKRKPINVLAFKSDNLDKQVPSLRFESQTGLEVSAKNEPSCDVGCVDTTGRLDEEAKSYLLIRHVNVVESQPVLRYQEEP